MKKILATFLSWLLLGTLAEGQSAKIPKEKIPQSLIDQVRLLQADFVSTLQRDCPEQACFPRGCVYGSHEVITLQGDSVLPGLPTEGKTRVGSEAQYFLTAVSCEYAYEDLLKEHEVVDLSQRVSTKLSNGVLKVNVRAMKMPKPIQDDKKLIKPLSSRQKLMQEIFSHFSWIMLFCLLLSALLLGLWSWRRLGVESKEAELRHIMLKRKLEREAEKLDSVPVAERAPTEEELLLLRLERLRPSLEMHKELIAQKCTQWLESEDFVSLAICLFLVSSTAPIQVRMGPEHMLLSEKFERFSQSFHPTLEQKRHVLDILEKVLATQGQIPCALGHGLQRLFRYFSPEDLSKMIEAQDLESQRCLIAMLPFSLLKDTLDNLSPKTIFSLAQSFWNQNRVSIQGIEGWEMAGLRAFEGGPMKVSGPSSLGPSLPVDASMLLSLMLPHISPQDRQKLSKDGRKPWIRSLFYPDLLRNLAPEKAQNILLSCDGRALAHWFSTLAPEDQALVWEILPPSYQVQMNSSMPETADPHLVLDVMRTCGKQLFRFHWQEGQAFGKTV